jgi:hypothetical protein
VCQKNLDSRWYPGVNELSYVREKWQVTSQVFTRITIVLSVTVTAVGAAVLWAAPAFAADTALCVVPANSGGTYVNCAQANGSGHTVTMPEGNPLNTTEWSVPIDRFGQISDVGTSLCMRVMHSDSNVVDLEACSDNAPTDQMWIDVNEGSVDGTPELEWINEAYSLCLNDDIYTGNLNAAPCNGGTNELFFN